MANISKKIIGFDLDGVIIDHTDLKIKLAKNFGYNLTPQQTASEVIKEILPAEIVHQIQKYLYDEPDVALKASLMSGAKIIFGKLKEFELPFVLISRRRQINP